MFKLSVQIYGIPREIAPLNDVELELPDQANLRDIINALKQKMPELEGPVICKGLNQLVEFYKFNVNGCFHYDDMDFQIHKGDRIALISPITGG